MVAPSLLVLRRTGGAAPSVHRLISGTSASPALGATFGANEAATYADSWSMHPRVAEFGGSIYALLEGTGNPQVYRRDGATWTLVFTASGSSGTNQRGSGLFVVNVGTGPILCFVTVVNTSSATFLVHRSTNGTVWTTTSGAIGGAAATSHGVLVHRGQIIFQAGGGSTTGIIDVGSGAISTASGLPSNSRPYFVGFRGRVFAVSAGTGSIRARFFELTGGAWVQMFELSSSGGQVNDVTNWMPCAFNFNNDSIGVIFLETITTTTTYYWNFAKLTPSGSGFTITYHPVVIPTALRAGGAAASKNLYGWHVFVDNESDPENPRYYIWNVPSPTGTFTAMEFTNTTTEMIGSPSGLAYSQFCLPATTVGGGERINTTDADLMVEARHDVHPSINGRIEWGVRVYNNPGAAENTLRGFFNTDEGPRYTQMQLVGTPSGQPGVVRNGDQIENVDADGTEVLVDWAVAAQGVQVGQPFHWKWHADTPS
jgi:hypothetical protein